MSYVDNDDNSEDGVITEDNLVRCANEWITWWAGYYSTAFVTARFMRTFCYVDAWTAGERRARGRRATLDFNNLRTIIMALVSEQREADPQFTLMPVNSEVPQETVTLRTDLLRYISQKSNAKMVYQTAYKDALDCGFGAYLIDTRYESPNSFWQEVYYKQIPDVLTCGWDVNAQHPNKTDGDYCYYTVIMSRSEFRRRFPKKDPSAAQVPISANTQSYGYISNDKTCYVTVCYYKEYYNKTISLLENGESYTLEEFKKYAAHQKKRRRVLMKNRDKFPPEAFDFLYQDTEISPVVEKRTSTDFKLKKAMVSTTEFLEVADFPGKLLPLIYVEGFSTTINGQQVPLPFAKAAIDAQRVMNYAGSEIADAMSKARKEQWIVTPKNIQGNEEAWKSPENIQGALQANPDPALNGPMGNMPYPVQNAPVLHPQYQQYYEQMQRDVQTTTGRFAENGGSGMAGDSGKAVIAKQMSGNLTVGVFADNLMDAIAEGARVVNGIVNEIYDTDREITVIDKNKKTKQVRINYKGTMPKYNPDIDDDEYESFNDMTKGEFEVTISAGGSFAAQQQLAFDQMMQLLKAADSPMFPYVADELAKLIDTPYTNEIVKRVKDFVVPPQVTAMDKNEPPPPPPPPTTQEKIAMMQEVVTMKSIEAQEIESKAKIINSIASVMTQRSKQKASEVASIAEIDKAITGANAEQVESISRVTKSLIETDNAKLRRENDVLKQAMGIQ